MKNLKVFYGKIKCKFQKKHQNQIESDEPSYNELKKWLNCRSRIGMKDFYEMWDIIETNELEEMAQELHWCLYWLDEHIEEYCEHLRDCGDSEEIIKETVSAFYNNRVDTGTGFGFNNNRICTTSNSGNLVRLTSRQLYNIVYNIYIDVFNEKS